MKLEVDEDRKSNFQLIHRNAKRLLNLVNQLLDFRKMEIKELRYNPSEGDIVNFIREIVYSFSDLSEKKKIDLTGNNIVLKMDYHRTQQKVRQYYINLLV